MRVIFYVIFVIIFITIPINAQNKRALLIGIASYPTYKIDKLGWNDIHGDNDVKLLRATLKKQGFSVNSVVNKHATAKGIRKALSNMVSNTKQGDIVYVHFSGHGQPYEDLNGDEEDGWDEAIIPYDAGARYVANVYEGNNHIVDDELNGYINQIRKRAGINGFVYVVIDACHAGGSSRMRNYSQEELALDFRKLTNGMLHGLTKDLLLEYLRKRVLQEPVTLRHAGRISQTLRLR